MCGASFVIIYNHSTDASISHCCSQRNVDDAIVAWCRDWSNDGAASASGTVWRQPHAAADHRPASNNSDSSSEFCVAAAAARARAVHLLFSERATIARAPPFCRQ